MSANALLCRELRCLEISYDSRVVNRFYINFAVRRLNDDTNARTYEQTMICPCRWRSGRTFPMEHRSE